MGTSNLQPVGPEAQMTNWTCDWHLKRVGRSLVRLGPPLWDPSLSSGGQCQN